MKIKFTLFVLPIIIASEIGRVLGFNVLEYNIAYKNGQIGCLSESMNAEDREELREGVRFLTGLDNSYLPDDKSSYSKYTFDFIRRALEEYGFGRFISDIVRVVIFDSIIGNSDRHQENWGVLMPLRKINIKESIPLLIEDPNGASFAPIYDSGSCLGRELEKNRIALMLADLQIFKAYVNKGVAEIRWEGPRLNHFELIGKLKAEYADLVAEVIGQVVQNFRQQDIENSVYRIDKQLPETLFRFKLPEQRKKLIVKMITLRFEKLKEELG